MSLSDCPCGGCIPLGPDASNRCERCGMHVMEPQKPVCSRCNDTHMVYYESVGQSCMCTHCPLPCRKCRANGNGPYCTTTPCACECHTMHTRASLPVAVSAWVPVATLPPVAHHDYYGDKFSVPVLLNVPYAKVFRWSFSFSGWVEAGWSDGFEPEDYDDWKLDQATHWQPLPAPPAALSGDGEGAV